MNTVTLHVRRELVEKASAGRLRIAAWKAEAERKIEQASADAETMIRGVNTWEP